MGIVLVVDDEPAVGSALDRLLDADGHVAMVVTSGSEAFELLGEVSVDVALVDLDLDDMSGLDLIPMLLGERPELVVLVISGHSDLDSIEKAFELGAFGFVRKPFDHTDLRINIVNGLARRDLQRRLGEEQARFRAAFEHSPAGIALVGSGPSPVVRDANREFDALFCNDGASVSGAPLAALLGPTAHTVEAAMAAHHDLDLEVELPGDDGATRWVRFVAGRRPADPGAPPEADVSMILHVLDITSQKAAEEQLRHMALFDALTGLPNRTLVL